MSSASLCSCARILMTEDQQTRVFLQFCKKQGQTEAQLIKSIEESWVLQSNFFFQLLLSICLVVDIHKGR